MTIISGTADYGTAELAYISSINLFFLYKYCSFSNSIPSVFSVCLHDSVLFRHICLVNKDCKHVSSRCPHCSLITSIYIYIYGLLVMLRRVLYSKAPHKRTSRLRTTSLKFGQLSIQNTSF
jgi:hypothetical protein